MKEGVWRRHKTALLSGCSCADALTDRRQTPPALQVAAPPPHAAAPPLPTHAPPPLEEDAAMMDIDEGGDELTSDGGVHGLATSQCRGRG